MILASCRDRIPVILYCIRCILKCHAIILESCQDHIPDILFLYQMHTKMSCHYSYQAERLDPCHVALCQMHTVINVMPLFLAAASPHHCILHCMYTIIGCHTIILVDSCQDPIIAIFNSVRRIP